MLLASLRRVILAHLSDAHLLALREDATLKDRIVSAGRSMDAQQRHARLVAALRAAKQGGAEHVVVTGDLAETGSVAQYEALAEAFSEARVDPSRVTLLPGNHDRYHAPDAWRRAMKGPLEAFAPTSACDDRLAVVELGASTLIAIDATRPQSIFRSEGELRGPVLMAIGREVAHATARGRHAILALHHPPAPLAPRAWHFWNGLDGAHELGVAAGAWPSITFLHGHSHHRRQTKLGHHHVHCAHASVALGARAVTLLSALDRSGAGFGGAALREQEGGEHDDRGGDASELAQHRERSEQEERAVLRKQQ